MAVRTDASADYVGRSASLPAPIGYTMAGWARMAVDRATFSSVCALSASPRTNGQLCLQTASDGNTFNLWYDSASIGVQEPSTGYAASVGVPFFWALVCEGTGSNQVKAYFRERGSNTFNVSFTATTGIGATFTPVLLRFGNADTNEYWDGDLWNIKVWERALTSKELLVESFYRHVQYPASLHLHYWLTNVNDTQDYSGNGRTATFNGTLASAPTTANYGMWKPRRQIIAAGAAAVPDRIVNATTQNLALTGQQAAVRKQRLVGATTQGLALTGQQASVRRNRTVQGTTQALALVGQPATVVRGSGRTVAATAAALALTGLPATIIRGSSAPTPFVGGGFPLYRVPAYDKRIEAVEEAIEEVIEAAAKVALLPPPAVNRARQELRRIAEAQKQRELDELEAKRIGAALDALEDDLLDVLERLLKRLTRKQKPRF